MARIAAFAFLALALGATAPQAATVSVAHQTFAIGAGAAARTALDGYAATGTVTREETFEQAAIDTATNRYVSPTVGTFQGLGGTGSGGSNVPLADQIQIRQTTTNIFGRQNLTPGGLRYLDSNDTLGWTWTIEAAALGLDYFTDIAFLLMDAGDQGATFQLKVDGTEVKTISGRNNGAIDFVALSFAQPTTSAVVNFANTVRRNDGFGLDQVRVYGEVAPIPLPPAVLMLGSALLGLGWFRRRAARA
jgi:hypothetical protein